MTDEEIDAYVDAMKTAVSYKMQATTLIQDTDYYSLILPNGAPVNEEDIIEPGSMQTPSGSDASSDGETGADETGASGETETTDETDVSDETGTTDET